MDKQVVFLILEIEETKDEAAISKAYRNKLRVTNPEDNPEGFKRLREAYEEALRLARISDEEEMDNKPKSEVDLWLSKVNDLYEDFCCRCDEERWKDILKDSVCEGLDTSLEAREKLFIFLMNHTNIPQKIWKLIDEEFEYIKDFKNLEERFPKNFLKYVEYNVEKGTFLDFDLFRLREDVPEPGSVDEYIDALFSVKDLIDKEDYDRAQEDFDILKAYGYVHPYEQVEKARLLVHQGKLDEAVKIVTDLREKYSENRYILFHYANVLAANGMKKEAYEHWLMCVEKDSEHYMAKYRIAEYLMETGDYYHAREYILDLLDHSNYSEELEKMMHTANQEMIPVYEEEMRTGAEDERFPKEELIFKLGWCLYQEGRTKEAADLFQDYEVTKEWEYDYCYLYGRILNQLELHEEAIPVLERCVELVEHMQDDGTKEIKKRLSRKYIVYNLIGLSYHRLGDEKKAEEVYRRNLAELTEARQKVETLYNFARIMMEAEQYEKTTDICDELIKINPQFFPAYLVRQEASFHLRRGQEVINDYHNAVNIFAGFYQPYKYALETFVIYNQYQDAREVIERAKENQAAFTDRMKLLEVKVLRNLAESNDDRIQPVSMAKQLKEHLEDEKCDIEDKSEVDFELALLFWDSDDFTDAFRYLELAIQKNPDRMQYHFVRGNIYLDRIRTNPGRYKEDFSKALKEYDMSEAQYSDSPHFMYGRAACFEGMDRKDEAVRQYEKLVREKGAFRDACEKVADYYDDLYHKEHDVTNFEKCIEILNIQIEASPSCYYYVHRGLKYMYNMDLELAIRDFDAALEKVPDDWAAWNNKGCCYKYRHEFGEAEECLKKAIACMGKDVKALPYYNLADCYERTEKYEEAIACYQKIMEIQPKKLKLWEAIAENYLMMGDYEKAAQFYNMAKDSVDYHANMGKLFLAQDKIKEGINELMKDVRVLKGDDLHLAGKKRLEIAEIHMELMNYNRALFVLRTLLLKTPSDEAKERFNIERYMAQCFYMKGERDKAKKHAKSAIKYFEKTGQGTLENYAGFQPYLPVRLGIMGWLFLCLGEEEKALGIFEKMEKVQCCRDCAYRKCYESSLYLARFYLVKGDTKKALSFYEEAFRRNGQCDEARRVLLKYRNKEL